MISGGNNWPQDFLVIKQPKGSACVLLVLTLKVQPWPRFVSPSTFHCQLLLSEGFLWLTCSPLPPWEPSRHCSPSIFHMHPALSRPVMKLLICGLWLQSNTVRSDCEISYQEQITSPATHKKKYLKDGRCNMDGQRMDVLSVRQSSVFELLHLWWKIRKDNVSKVSFIAYLYICKKKLLYHTTLSFMQLWTIAK